MRRVVTLSLLGLALCCARAVAQDAKSASPRLMTRTQYADFLDRADSNLRAFEEALKGIDPAKFNTSYAAGALIVKNRDEALRNAGYAHALIMEQRAKRTLSGELALSTLLQALIVLSAAEEMTEMAAELKSSGLNTYVTEIGAAVTQLTDDLQGRIELLEKNTCPDG
jgi:hypothetical protein